VNLMHKLPHASHAAIVAYLALFVALGGSAYAVSGSNIPAPIRACYVKKTGALSLLRAKRCARGQRGVSWTTRGVAGPPGSAGRPGPDGQTGPQGPPGATGAVDTSQFYTKSQGDARYLLSAATATNSSELGGQPPSAFTASSRFGTAAFPSPSQSSATDPDCIVGEIKLTAGNLIPMGWMPALGQTLPISQNMALFSLLGDDYGGNGTANFDLPNLQAADPKGTGPAGVSYDICVSGVFP
jgi:hypothetical protein